jgi:hypothetical protein
MIQRLGRFPDRNRVLRRLYTEAEAQYAGVALEELNQELQEVTDAPQMQRQSTLGRIRLFGSNGSQGSAI